jgi:hypothetical protein
MSTSTSIAIFLAILFTATNAVPYSKYGRTCKDIGCRSDEVCVMAEDPCSGYRQDSCGRYPTCQRTSNGGESCTTKICPSGQYCKTENGRPTCVNTTPGLGPGRKPGGYQRPSVVPVRPSPPVRPVVPTPPPRSSSFGDRRNGQSGNRNSIGNNSIWDRLFGGGDGGRSRPSGPSGYQRPTSKPASNYYPGGNGYYNTHTNTDSNGNRVWTFSG